MSIAEGCAHPERRSYLPPRRLVDEAYGNSVNAQRVAKFLSARLGMDLLISSPAEEPSHVALPAS